MSVDFPRAWEITQATEREYHHNQCSYNTHGLLCDCNVLMKHAETVDKQYFYGAGGRIINRQEVKP